MSFEEIKMEEDESFDEFYTKLKDMVNLAFNLGETIPEPKIVRKVLRSLPKRFHAKIIAIEESKDIDKIPLTELIGNLQTYELGLTRHGKGTKSKSIALKAKSNETDESSNDEDSRMKSYITRQFKKFLKNANVKGFDKDDGQYTVPSEPKCFRCHGFGHMKQKCLTYLKSIGKSKALATTLSDTKLETELDDSDDEGILSAFTAIVDPTKGIIEAVDEEEDLWNPNLRKWTIKMTSI